MSDGLKKALVGVIALVLVSLAARSACRNLGEPEQTGNVRVLMDLETGELFEKTLDKNYGPHPHKNPKTGTMTLFPTEVCYSGECLAANGTRVILNTWTDKPEEPTYCPKCGALVRFRNPGRPRNSAGSD